MQEWVDENSQGTYRWEVAESGIYICVWDGYTAHTA